MQKMYKGNLYLTEGLKMFVTLKRGGGGTKKKNAWGGGGGSKGIP